MRSFFLKHAVKCYAILRIVAGLLFACHGAQKLFGVLGAQSEIHDPEGLIAGVVEFGGGILIAIGLLTRIAAFFASGEMAVAYFKVHVSRSFWPIVSHGELAVLYCFVFLYILFRGGGEWSLDSLRKRRRHQA
jgi:putative oxidoreductase